MITFTRNRGENRGKPRLWIEGKHLIEAGLGHGVQWVLVPVIGGFDIAKIPATTESKVDGRRVRKIAGTAKRPIVDITGANLGAIAEIETAYLAYSAGSGFLSVRIEP